jgi:type II secretory pathway component PulJ
VLYEAVDAAHNNAETLQYLWERGVQVETAELTELLHYAGINDQLASAKWLRQQGAQWPQVLCDDYGNVWTEFMADWAESEGYVAPDFGDYSTAH